MKTRLLSTKGSVSIYFMIILTAIFMFNAVLIDFTRIKVAEKQTEAAIKAGLRSALSHYDSSLQSYGLYAMSGKEEGEQIYKYVLEEHFKENASTPEDSGVNVFHLIKPRWKEESLKLDKVYTLADHEVFKQQVLEEMKYSAPIEFILGVTDKLQKSGAYPQMQEASNYSKAAEDIEALIKNREESLDQAWDEAADMSGIGGEVEKFHHYYEEKMKDLQQKVQEIEDYQFSKQELDKHDERQVKEAQKTLLLLIAKYTSLLLETSISLELHYEQLIEMQSQIAEHLNTAMDYNDQIQNKISTSAATGLNKADEVYEHVQVIERGYFVEYEVEIGKIISLFSGFKSQIDATKLITTEDFDHSYESLIASNKHYANQSRDFYSKQFIIEEKRKRRNAGIAEQENEQIAKINEVLKQIKNIFSDCGDIDSIYYEQLKRMDWDDSDHLDTANMDTVNVHTDAKDIGKKSMNLVDLLGLGLLNIRDQVYLNEYALSKFNYRSLGKSYALSEPSLHKLHNQEVEYILYGLNSCEFNQGAAYGEIFALRLAIRTMEALTDPDRAILQTGSPMLAFLWAAAEGAVKAYEDMKQLTEGKEVLLSSKVSNSIALNYKDYLRLFMLIHGKDEHLIKRMQALIQLNEDVILRNKATYVQASAASLIRLWFIPGVMEWLGYEVKGREAVFTKEVILSY